jgi:ABC-type glycerol-3-phosphate transport system substrate-binding protein
MTSDKDQHDDGLGKKRITRRELLKMSAAGAAGLALAACSTPPAATTAPSGAAAPTQAPSTGGTGAKKTVRFWSWYQEQQDQFPKVISDFEAKNPDIKVELSLLTDVTGGYLPALLAAAAADDLPEIYAPHVHSVTFGKKGLGADLVQTLGADFMTDFFPSAISMFQDGKAVYAVGWMAQTMGIFYDPDQFTQAGISEPQTWDDAIAGSKAVKEKISGNLGFLQIGSDGFSVCDTWLPMITGVTDDPDILRQLDYHERPWTDQAVVDSLIVYKKTLDEKMWQDNMTGMKSQDCANAFYQGKAAAYYSGSWNPTTFYKEAPPELMKRMKVMKTPAVKSGGRHWTGNSAGAAFSLSNHSKNKDAAVTFFRYLYSPEVYAWTMNDSKSMPATKAAAAQISEPLTKEMASWLPDGCRHWLTGPAGQVIADAIMDFTAGNTTDPKAVAQIMEDGAAKQKY